MSKKTPKQIAEEWAKEYYDEEDVPFLETRGLMQAIGKTSFLAGRKHFIERELRKYLEMAWKSGHKWTFRSQHGEPSENILEIIKKAKED